jgi:hypothetical protein
MGSELRIPNAAAQTRIVSGGPFGRPKGSLSRNLKYMAGACIAEFGSYMLSQPASPCLRRGLHVSVRKPRGCGGLVGIGLVSVCRIGQRKRHFGRLSPTAVFERPSRSTMKKGCPPRSPSGNRHSCDGRHIGSSAPHLACEVLVRGGCDMVADWIVIYAVLFILAAVVVGRVPAEG